MLKRLSFLLLKFWEKHFVLETWDSTFIYQFTDENCTSSYSGQTYRHTNKHNFLWAGTPVIGTVSTTTTKKLWKIFIFFFVLALMKKKYDSYLTNNMFIINNMLWYCCLCLCHIRWILFQISMKCRVLWLFYSVNIT